MEPIPQAILTFLREHHVLTLATSIGDRPYCANCFYFLEDDSALIFASESHTKHIQDSLQNDRVAVAVFLETLDVGEIRGVQMCGQLVELTGEAYAHSRQSYLDAFPFADVKKTPLWAFRPDFIKMTDNRQGFGNKLIWGSCQ